MAASNNSTIVVRVLGNAKGLGRTLNKASRSVGRFSASTSRVTAQIGAQTLAAAATTAKALAIVSAASVASSAAISGSLAAVPAILGAIAVGAAAIGTGAAAFGAGGVLALGAKFAFASKEAQESLDALKEKVNVRLAEIAKPMRGAVTRALETLTKAFDGPLKSLGPLFEKAAGLTDDLVKRLLPVASKIGPMLTAAFDAGAPVLKAIADNVGVLVDGITNFFKALGGESGTFAAFVKLASTTGAKAMESFGKLFAELAPIGLQIAEKVFPKFIELLDKLTANAKPLYDKLLPVFEGVSSALGAITDGLGGLFKGLDPAAFATFAKSLGAIGGLLPLLAPLLNILAPLATTLVTALAPALSVVIEALTAGLAPVAKVLGDTLAAILPVLGQLIASFLEVAGPVIAAVLRAVTPLVPVIATIVEAFLPLIPVLGKIVTTLITALAPILQALAPVFAIIADVLGQVLLALVPLIQPIAALALALTPLIVLVAQFAAQLIDMLLPVLVPLITQIIAFAQVAIGPLTEAMTQMMPALLSIIDAVLKLLPAFLPLIPAILSVSLAILPLLPVIADLVAQLVNKLLPAVLPILTSLTNLATLIATVLSAGLGALVTLIKDKVVGALVSAGSWLIETGGNIVQGLIDGVLGMAGTLAEKIKGFISDNVPDVVKNLLGIASPSKLFKKFGRYTVQGLALGIKQSQGLAAAAATKLSGAVADGFSAPALTLNARPALTPAAATGASSGTRTYQITVQAPVGASSADIGRELTKHIAAFETAGGRRRA